MKETVQQLSEIAIYKKDKMQTNKQGYLMLTMLGGMLVGVGMILLIVIGGLLDPAGVPGIKILQGMTFGVALSMVIIGGADLYTGNNLIMAIGVLERKTGWLDLTKILTFSWLGNFLGAILLATLFVVGGLAVGDIANYIMKITIAKTEPTFIEILARGILCNFLVCYAVWCANKVQNEAAKILLIFCCIFPFITAGFEHCVANMTLFSLAYLIDPSIELTGIVKNLVASSIGNAIGGAILVGYAFWLAQKR